MSAPFQLPAGLTARDKWMLGGGLVALCGLAWAATAWQAGAMMPMDASGVGAMGMARLPLAGLDLALVYLMWVVMMVAMMVPGASPMVAVFAAINRRRREEGSPWVRTKVFLLGYLIAWSMFSLAATGVHWMLDRGELLTPMMESASPALSAALFAAAGLYQWTPLKDVCLKHCRTPVGFVLSEWRDGALGAIVMGLRHGLFCVGCCAAIMGLLFAVAIMDLRWVAAIAVLVTLEKLLPWPRFWRYLIGAIFMASALGFATGRITAGELVGDRFVGDEAATAVDAVLWSRLPGGQRAVVLAEVKLRTLPSRPDKA